MKPIAVGQRGAFEQTVLPAHSASNFGNSGVEVLATPVLCHWFETTAVIAIHEQLESEEATVGTQLSIEHLKATPLGMKVRVVAEVVVVQNRRISFRIEAHDDLELVARGTHERFVVNLARFLESVRAKALLQPH